MNRLTGKVALVTGASRGIGRSVAEAFAREGARVFLVGNRDRAALDEVQQAIRARGSDADSGLYDVGDPADVRRLADDVERTFGTLDIVVNNAGVMNPTPILEITPEQWENTIRVHVHGAFYTLQEMTRRFLKPKGKGKIINVSSIGALRASDNNADYAAAKSAILALTRNAARDLAPFNIQVNAVLPIAYTRMMETLAVTRPGQAEVMRATPGPENVTPTFVFLASDESDYVSAQFIGADGGRSA